MTTCTRFAISLVFLLAAVLPSHACQDLPVLKMSFAEFSSRAVRHDPQCIAAYLDLEGLRRDGVRTSYAPVTTGIDLERGARRIWVRLGNDYRAATLSQEARTSPPFSGVVWEVEAYGKTRLAAGRLADEEDRLAVTRLRLSQGRAIAEALHVLGELECNPQGLSRLAHELAARLGYDYPAYVELIDTPNLALSNLAWRQSELLEAWVMNDIEVIEARMTAYRAAARDYGTLQWRAGLRWAEDTLPTVILGVSLMLPISTAPSNRGSEVDPARQLIGAAERRSLVRLASAIEELELASMAAISGGSGRKHEGLALVFLSRLGEFPADPVALQSGQGNSHR